MLPLSGSSENSTSNEPYIRAYDEYVYESRFNLSTGYNDRLEYHSLGVIAENLQEAKPHNLTLTLETEEKIEYVRLRYPSGDVQNYSQNGKHHISALFNGTNCELELRFIDTKTHPEPINLSVTPSDTILFSLDLQNHLRFGIWLNVSRPLHTAWLRVSSRSYSKPYIKKFTVNTELKTGMNYTWDDQMELKLQDVPIGDHYLQLEIVYEGSEGDFYVSTSTSEMNSFTIPTSFFLDEVEVFPEKILLFRYFTYSVQFLSGVVPWVYGYRDPAGYNLDYVSSSKLVLRIDKNSREQLEYFLLDSEIEKFEVKEIYVFGNPCYQIVLNLN